MHMEGEYLGKHLDFEHFRWNSGRRTCLSPYALDSIFKDAEVLLPPGREAAG